MTNFKRELMLNSLILCSTLWAAGCGSPDSGTTTADAGKHWDVSSYFGIVMTVDIDAANQLALHAQKFDATGSLLPFADVSGHCGAPAMGTGIITCSATSSTAPSFVASDATLRLLSVPGVSLYLKIEPAAMATTSETFLTDAAQFFETESNCATVTGDYSYLKDNVTTFGIHRLSLAANEFRTADFKLSLSGTSISSDYTTDLGGGNGIHNVLSSSCTGGTHILHLSDPGWVPNFPVFVTTSGLANIGTDTAIPKDKIVALSALAGKAFSGVQVTNGSLTIPVHFDFGALGADSSVGVTNFNFGSGASLDYSLIGFKLLSASGSAAGARYGAAVPALNALSADYATAATVPGLMYSTTSVSAGEEPALALAWSTPSGKVGILILHTRRDSAFSSSYGYAFTTAIEE